MKAFSLPQHCRDNEIGYKQLAKLLGISESYACQLRSGEKSLTLGIAVKLKRWLGLPLDLLLDNGNGKTLKQRK